MKLNIVIPSRDREEKLINCLKSIDRARKGYDFDVYIFLHPTDNVPNFKRDWLEYRTVKEYIVPKFWNSYLKNMQADALFYCNDDCELYEDTIERLYKNYLQTFPNYDGLMGIKQENIPMQQQVKTAFGVIGAKYADRFPNRQVFCPYYMRFYGDKEMEMYASSIGKLMFSENTKIIHYHPSFYKDKMDKTHELVRMFHSQDRRTFNRRMVKKLLWGRDYSNF